MCDSVSSIHHPSPTALLALHLTIKKPDHMVTVVPPMEQRTHHELARRHKERTDCLPLGSHSGRPSDDSDHMATGF